MIPLQIILALLILYKNLRLASVSALAATVLLMLANLPLGKFQNKYQDKTMKSKDARMKVTSEVLRNMRLLKLQGWEMKFMSMIMELKTKEENWLKKVNYTSAAMMVVFWGAPTFVVVVTFVSCLLMGKPLESGSL
ncbi:hypothetical protein MRB53_006245 [Persea americana]|uniref:Uncharacterized protein n=1 Tax=Persea americana TaxID=3435 RepID=A0ACC2MFK6_PERAE|nr:hypothetical protein MRB53_006245 [Persea americana]